MSLSFYVWLSSLWRAPSSVTTDAFRAHNGASAMVHVDSRVSAFNACLNSCSATSCTRYNIVNGNCEAVGISPGCESSGMCVPSDRSSLFSDSGGSFPSSTLFRCSPRRCLSELYSLKFIRGVGLSRVGYFDVFQSDVVRRSSFAAGDGGELLLNTTRHVRFSGTRLISDFSDLGSEWDSQIVSDIVSVCEAITSFDNMSATLLNHSISYVRDAYFDSGREGRATRWKLRVDDFYARRYPAAHKLLDVGAFLMNESLCDVFPAESDVFV